MFLRANYPENNFKPSPRSIYFVNVEKPLRLNANETKLLTVNHPYFECWLKNFEAWFLA